MHSEAANIRAESPVIVGSIESPNKLLTQSITKSSWCSSPFSNLGGVLSPDGNSFFLDFSPTSPRLPNEAESPQSAGKMFRLFSPSFFSPFNKSRKSGKLENVLDKDSPLKVGQSPASHYKSIQSPYDSGDFELFGGAQLSPFKVNSVTIEEKYSNGVGIKHELFPLETVENIRNPPTFPTNKIKTPNQLSQAKSKGNTSVTPAKKNLAFSTPDELLRAKQAPTNISPMTAIAEINTNGTEPGTCNCKKSKCLKLYCECFTALRYCDGCHCTDCQNNIAHEDARQVAIAQTKEKSNSAFQSKVNTKSGHMTGCHCKKSQCLKKYCECFEGQVYCGDNCKCVSCQNLAPDKTKANYSKLQQAIVQQQISPTKYLPNIVVDSSSKTLPLVQKKRDRSAIEPPSSPPQNKISSTLQRVQTWAVSPSSDTSSQISPSSSGSEKSPVNKMYASTLPLKKRNFMKHAKEPHYLFFGNDMPPMPKITALRILEFLDGKSIYAMSCVNRLWSKAAMDDALWE